jgi:hypothetical protein
MPKVCLGRLETIEEGYWRSERVKERARQISEDSVPVRADKRRDAKERMRQVWGWKEITRDRRPFVGKWKGPGEVGRITHLERRAVRKREGDRRQRLAREEGGKRREAGKLDEETSAARVGDEWRGQEESRHSS